MSGFDFSLFDDATLEAASNKGLVRRAQRDAEAGLVRIESREDARVILKADDGTVTIMPGGLKGCKCSCPSRVLCRHVLAAVIFLRSGDTTPAGTASGSAEQPPTVALEVPRPAEVRKAADPVQEICTFTEESLRKAFGRAALRAAMERLGEGTPVIRQDGAAMIVAFPDDGEVRYLAGLGLAGMISKAKPAAQKELHAAAILAVRQANGLVLSEVLPPADEAVGVDPAYLDAVQGALEDMLRSCFSAGSQAVEERLFDLAISSRADDLPNLSARLRRLVRAARAKRRDDASFDALDTLKALARTFGLVTALRSHGPDGVLRGEVRETYVERPEALDLVGCGIDIWTAPSGARGATAWFLGEQAPFWHSLSLSRSAGQDPSFDPVRAARQEMIWGKTLSELATAHVTASGASVSPSGRLSSSRPLGVEVRLVSATEEHTQQSEIFSDWELLRRALARRLARGLREETRSSPPVVLLPASVGKPFLDEMSQRLVMPVEDERGRSLALTLSADDERRIDALDHWRDAAPRLIVASVVADQDGFALTPFAFAMPYGPVQSLALMPPRLLRPTGMFAPLKQRLDAFKERFSADDKRELIVTSANATRRLLANILDEVLAFAELRGRMLDNARLEHLRRLSTRLHNYGLEPLGLLAARVCETGDAKRPASMLALAFAAETAIRLDPSLPTVGAGR